MSSAYASEYTFLHPILTSSQPLFFIFSSKYAISRLNNSGLRGYSIYLPSRSELLSCLISRSNFNSCLSIQIQTSFYQPLSHPPFPHCFFLNFSIDRVESRLQVYEKCQQFPPYLNFYLPSNSTRIIVNCSLPPFKFRLVIRY